jgi:hypothetical protein
MMSQTWQWEINQSWLLVSLVCIHVNVENLIVRGSNLCLYLSPSRHKGYLTAEWEAFDAMMNEAGTVEARRGHLLGLTILPF